MSQPLVGLSGFPFVLIMEENCGKCSGKNTVENAVKDACLSRLSLDVSKAECATPMPIVFHHCIVSCIRPLYAFCK